MPYLVTFDPATGAHHVLDLTSSTVDGAPIGKAILGGIGIFQLDWSGQFVTFNTAMGPTAWVWTLATGVVEPVSPCLNAVGWGTYVERDYRHDSYQFLISPLGNPTSPFPIIAPSPTPADTQAAAAVSWANSTSAARVPFIAGTMRDPTDMGPWRAWDDELIAVETDLVNLAGDGGSPPANRVWRFTHLFNTYTGPTASDAFYYLYKPRVSNNGWFAVFDSNWNASLGTDTTGQPRTDAFVAALANPCGP